MPPRRAGAAVSGVGRRNFCRALDNKRSKKKMEAEKHKWIIDVPTRCAVSERMIDEELLKAIGYYRPPSSCDEESEDNFYSLDPAQYKSPQDSPLLGDASRRGSYNSVKSKRKQWRKELRRRIKHGGQSTANKLKNKHTMKPEDAVGLFIKGMSRQRQKTRHNTAKHGHFITNNNSRVSGGAGKPGQRPDSYRMRRRYMHGGVTGDANGSGMYDGDDIDGNPFLDHDVFGNESVLEDFDHGDEDTETCSESDEDSVLSEPVDQREQFIDGPPPLETDDHFHLFFYHSPAVEDQEQVKQLKKILENNPYELKVMTSMDDYKPELTATQNLMLCAGLSQKTVLLCSQEFADNNLNNYISSGLQFQEKSSNRVIVLLGEGVPLPESLQGYCKVLSLTDQDCLEKLAKMVGRHSAVGKNHGNNSAEKSNPEPSAPPPDEEETAPRNVRKGERRGAEEESTAPAPEAKESTTIYLNGTVIKKVTACNYTAFESRDAELGICQTYCPQSDLLCPREEPNYKIPSVLSRRGLQVTEGEFAHILHSLTEASNVTFFQKAVDCSLPCLYLSVVVIVSFISCCTWFLVIGALNHYKSETTISTPTFWSFMTFVFFIPGGTALIMLMIVLHLVNYKYLKYRLKVEEFNKRFRETNLVLHVRKGFWSCSGKLKLFFIYYNFEECQQTLYCHVHDNMRFPITPNWEENEKLLNDIATVKLDRIMKRVNTLTKKFEWDYFEALTTQALPNVEDKEHRKKGMCFCQYVLHREQIAAAAKSVVQQVKGQMHSMRRHTSIQINLRGQDNYNIPAYHLHPSGMSDSSFSSRDHHKQASVTFM